ncbi:MAG: tol-pal system protein YbgF [Kiloniellales bacterium]
MNAGFAAALLLGVLGFTVPAAFAQDAQVKGLIDRIDRLQREMSTLQRQVYRGDPPPAAATDAPASSGGLSNTAGARIELRLSQLEVEMRTLTGQIEEATFGINQLRDRLDRLAADIDLRLQRLEQDAPAMAGGQGAPGAQIASTGSANTFDTAPKVLGTINPDDLRALQTQPVEQMSPAAQATGQAGAAVQREAGGQQTANLIYPLAGDTPEERYRHAFGLLSQANYGEAELALRAFLVQHPKNPLSGNAKYWLGETYYVRQDFQQAAVTFAEAFQEFPENSKAPDNLLKLGMSLAALGSKSDACGTFTELLKRYPEAAVTVIQRAKQERQRLSCP